MLNTFRDNLKSLKWILWVVAASMVLYLGALFDCGRSGTASARWVARVDGGEISEVDFQNAAFNIERGYKQLFGDSYEQLKGSLNIGNEALQSLIRRWLILEDARALGLTA